MFFSFLFDFFLYRLAAETPVRVVSAALLQFLVSSLLPTTSSVGWSALFMSGRGVFTLVIGDGHETTAEGAIGLIFLVVGKRVYCAL